MTGGPPSFFLSLEPGGSRAGGYLEVSAASLTSSALCSPESRSAAALSLSTAAEASSDAESAAASEASAAESEADSMAEAVVSAAVLPPLLQPDRPKAMAPAAASTAN